MIHDVGSWQVFMFMDGPPEYHCRLGAAGMDVRLMRLQGTQPVVLRSFTAPLQPFLESWIREFDTLSYRYGNLSDTAYEEAEIENCLDLRRQIVRALADIEAGDSEAMAS